MFTKLYEKIKEIMKQYYKPFLIFFLIFVVCTVPLPYYINTPGGIIDLKDKVSVSNAYPQKGSFYLSYVTELKATVPTMLLSFLNSDWDVLKQNEVVASNENVSDLEFRNHLMLEEANMNAILVAYQRAGKKVQIKDCKVIVTYVDREAKTDLKVGDVLLKIGNQAVSSKLKAMELLQTYQAGDTITMMVSSNGVEMEKKATLMEVDSKVVIGILISEERSFTLDPDLKLSFRASESGPSGGLMMALAIYNALTPFDITKGSKIVGTGTIDSEGNVGSIGGVEYKLKGVVKAKAKIFLVPAGENYEEAIKLKTEKNYDIEIIPIKTFDQAVEYLKNR